MSTEGIRDKRGSCELAVYIVIQNKRCIHQHVYCFSKNLRTSGCSQRSPQHLEEVSSTCQEETQPTRPCSPYSCRPTPWTRRLPDPQTSRHAPLRQRFGSEEGPVIILATSDNLNILAESLSWYLYGTFKSSPNSSTRSLSSMRNSPPSQMTDPGVSPQLLPTAPSWLPK